MTKSPFKLRKDFYYDKAQLESGTTAAVSVLRESKTCKKISHQYDEGVQRVCQRTNELSRKHCGVILTGRRVSTAVVSKPER